MIRRIPAFQQAAVCLTKFGPESGETAKEIVARKDLERRAGVGTHKNEFWWGVGEKSTAQSTQTLISQHGGNTVLFSAIKDQTPPNNGSTTNASRVDHLSCSDQGRHHSDEAFRPCLQLKCPIEDRRARFQILLPSLQNLQQRRQAWKVCKRQTNYRSIGQVDELSDFGSGVR
jgi:hypothetical protein